MEGSREQNRRDDDAPEAGLTGTLFQRRLATALATRPHARSLGTNILGASPLRTGLSLGWRRKRTLEREGFDTTVAPGGVLDVDELIHIHGRRLPRIMSNKKRQQDEELRPMDGGSATGSLRRVTVSEADRRRGAVDATTGPRRMVQSVQTRPSWGTAPSARKPVTAPSRQPLPSP